MGKVTKQEELKSQYEEIIHLNSRFSLENLLKQNFPQITIFHPWSDSTSFSLDRYGEAMYSAIDNFIISHLVEIETLIDDYMDSIANDHSRWIAANRLQIEFKSTFHQYSHHTCYRFEDNKEGHFYNITPLIQKFHSTLANETMPDVISELEFKLIGATPKARKNNQNLSLTQRQINLLFHALIKTNVVSSKVKDVAQGLHTMTSFGFHFFSQNLNTPLNDNKDAPPSKKDFEKVSEKLKDITAYLDKIKLKNGYK